MKRVGLVVVGGLVLAACGGPLGPIAGGELVGVEAEPPAQWGAVPETVQLEVRPAAPYSVNVWGVGIGANLYVAHGPEGSTWGTRLQADPRARVRIGDAVYAVEAVVVEEAAERERVVDAYVAKYGADVEEGFRPIRDRREEAMEQALDNVGGTIYRLQPRQGGSASPVDESAAMPLTGS